MSDRTPFRFVLILSVFLTLQLSTLWAQQPNALPVEAGRKADVPRLIAFSGIAKTRDGAAIGGVFGITVALYGDREGGSPLWVETQNVTADEQGRYTIFLGSATGDGLPRDLFTTGEPRWLGMTLQLAGEQEQPRFLFSSVPYAFKAVDAETLGGRPPSAYVLADSIGKRDSDSNNSATDKVTVGGVNGSPSPLVSGTGTQNRMVKWTDFLGTEGDSSISDFGTGVAITVSATNKVGVGTASPSAVLDIRNTASINSTPLDIHQANGGPYAMRFFNDTYGGVAGATFFVTDTGEGNVGSGGPTNFNFLTNGAIRWKIAGNGHLLAGVDNAFDIGATGARPRNVFVGNNGIFNGAVGIGTQNPSVKLDVSGDVKASGTITGNGSGLTNLPATSLTGTIPNGLTTATNLNTPSAIVARDASGNFSAGNIGANAVTATTFTGGGSGLTNVNATTLGGQAAANYARTDQGNALTGTQSVNGAVRVNTNGYEQLSVDSNGNFVSLGSLYVGTGNFVAASGSDLLVGQATNGATVANVFRVDSTGKGYFNGSTQTGGADFAESFDVQGKAASYEPGDVLAIDTTGHRRLTLASGRYSKLVAGIYSTKPGVLATPHTIDADLSGEVPLAVVGVVPCKVSAENGPIKTGDLLVTASVPGYAMRGSDAKRMMGAVVGKALEPLASGKGVIQVLVTLQ